MCNTAVTLAPALPPQRARSKCAAGLPRLDTTVQRFEVLPPTTARFVKCSKHVMPPQWLQCKRLHTLYWSLGKCFRCARCSKRPRCETCCLLAALHGTAGAPTTGANHFPVACNIAGKCFRCTRCSKRPSCETCCLLTALHGTAGANNCAAGCSNAGNCFNYHCNKTVPSVLQGSQNVPGV